MADESERAVQAAIEAEVRLLDPDVRASPVLVSELLDPEFTEIGASGRRWDATSILIVASAGSVSPESPIKVTEMTGVVLAPGIVHLTYFRRQQRAPSMAELRVASDGNGVAHVLSPGHFGELSVGWSAARE